MSLSFELLSITLPALCVAVMVALMHAPLGVEVLKRGIIFIDLAIAQIVGLGLLLAQSVVHDPSWWQIQLTAFLCAALAGACFHWSEQKIPNYQEAIIGCSFVVAATLTLLLLADNPHGGDEIQHLLSGQILFVTWESILKQVPVCVAVLLVWLKFPLVRRGFGFYLLFGLAITSSVQLVGVYVVFATLILPALAASSRPQPYKIASACGVLSAIVGVLTSVLLDLPTGPVIVLSCVVISVVFASLVRKAKS